MEQIKNFFFVNTNTKQTVIKNTVWLFFGEVIGRLFKMILVIYAARTLGLTGWGLFSYILAFASLFISFTDVGLNTLATKELSTDNDYKTSYFSTAFYLKFSLLIFASLLTFVLIHLGKIKVDGWLVFFVLLFLVFDSLREFFMSFHRSLEKMEREAVLKIIAYASVGILGILFLFLYKNVFFLAVGYSIGAFIGLLFSIFSLAEYRREIFFNFSKKLALIIFVAALPITINFAVNTTAFNVDTLILGYFKGVQQVGLYSSAQRIILFLYVIPAFLSISLLPTLVRSAKEDIQKFKNLLKKYAKFYSGLAIVVAVLGMFFSRTIIILIYGKDYIGSIDALRILFISLIPTFLNFLIIYGSIAANKQRKLLIANICALVFNLVFNII